MAILMINCFQNRKEGSQSHLCPEKALNRATAITSSSQSATSLAMKSLTIALFTFEIESIFQIKTLPFLAWYSVNVTLSLQMLGTKSVSC